MQRTRTIAGPIIVIVCYRPKPRKAKDLLKCVKDHMPILRRQKLVTSRKSIVGRAKDGTIVEVFEWKSQAAISAAHRNPEVLRLWERYGACCNIVKYGALAEAKEMFPGLEPVD